MYFTAPLFLLGIAAAAVPVLIHLYGRRRARRQSFASVRLLQQQRFLQQSSLLRVRNLWLMLLRVLVIVLLSTALAGPQAPLVQVTGIHPNDAVWIVLDDSLSMRTEEADGRRFDIAVGAALDLLGTGHSGQVCRVVVAGHGGRPLLAGTVGEAVELLERLSPSYSAIDVGAVMVEAAQLAADETGGNALLFCFTDLQTASWTQVQPAMPPATRLTIVDCGTVKSNNAIGPVGGRESGPALQHRPWLVHAPVRRYAAQDAPPRPYEVRIETDEGELPSVSLPGTAPVEHLLTEWRPDAAGLQRTTVRLETDSLPADDTAYHVTDVRASLRVAVPGDGEAAQLLRLALSPTSQGPVYAENVTVIEETEKAPPDACVVLDGAFAAANPAALQEFMAAGGGLVVWLAESAAFADGALLPELLGDDTPTLGPAKERTPPIRFGAFAAHRPPLGAFTNPDAGDLGAVTFTNVRDVSLPDDSAWLIHAQYGDGTPLVMERKIGPATVLAVNAALSPEASTLTQEPVFVPLAHRLVAHVARPRALPPLYVGAPQALPDFLPGVPVSLTSDTGRSGDTWDTGTGRRFRANHPGYHTLTWTDAAGEIHSLPVAANIHPAAADPARHSVQTLQAAVGGMLFVVPAREMPQALPRIPLSLAAPLLALVAALLTAEMLFAQRLHGRLREPQTDIRGAT